MKKRIIILMAIMTLGISGCQLQLPGQKGKEDNKPAEQEQVEEQQTPTEPEDQEKEEELTENEEIPALPAHNFNNVAQVDGKSVITNPENMLVLVNKEFALSGAYKPGDLIRPEVAFSFGEEENEKALMRTEAAAALKELFNAATSEGIELFAVSGYRAYERQNVIFNAEVAKVGQELAEQAVAFPGQSEHQTGLAMDISSRSANFELTQEFEFTTEGKWLKANAHRFGFILRYPKGKETITGYKFEPWHFRYVGQPSATEMFNRDLTLEEYFNIVKKI